MSSMHHSVDNPNLKVLLCGLSTAAVAGIDVICEDIEYIKVKSSDSLYVWLDQLVQAQTPLLGVVWRLSGGDDPIRWLMIAREVGFSAPMLIWCRSGVEAAYYHRQDHSIYAWAGAPDAEVVPAAVLAVLSSAASQRQRLMRPLPERGDVSDEDLVCLLGELFRRRVSGELLLKRSQITRTLTLLEGEVVFADSSLLDENLGRFLLAQGIISKIEYRWSQRLQAREGIRQGEALVKIGVLTEQALRGLLCKQLMQKFSNSFSGGVSEFTFSSTAQQIEPSSVYHFNILEVLQQSLWRQLPPVEISQRWAVYRDQSLIFLPVDATLASLIDAHMPSLRAYGLATPLHEISALRALPERERLALIDSLLLLEAITLTDTLPKGLYAPANPALHLPAPQQRLNATDLQALIKQHLIADTLDLRVALGLSPHTSHADARAVVQRLLSDTFARARFSHDAETLSALKILRARLHRLLATSAQVAPSVEPPEVRARRRVRAIEAEEAYQAGLDHLDAERFQDALRAFQSAQALNDQEPLYMLYCGWTYLSMSEPDTDDWSRGKHLLEDAQAANPLMTESYLLRARVALAEGMPHDARELLSIALRFSPQHRQAVAMRDALDRGQTPQDLQDEWPDIL